MMNGLVDESCVPTYNSSTANFIHQNKKQSIFLGNMHHYALPQLQPGTVHVPSLVALHPVDNLGLQSWP
jgi:cephalosporin-C deacetylase-like acetyl esterase